MTWYVFITTQEHGLSLISTFLQRAFQTQLPAMIQVIGQCVQAGNETGARQLFDVLETLLILVRSFSAAFQIQRLTRSARRKFLFLGSTSRNSRHSFFSAEATVVSIQNYVS